MVASKRGRPTDNPRPHKISIHLNDESKEILETYCLRENIRKTEAIERGIKKFTGDLKEK